LIENKMKLANCHAFHIWVANTIADLGGNAAQYLRGVASKRALTYGATRTASCQGVFRRQRKYFCKVSRLVLR
jgi:hypothetical protein